MSDDIAHIPPPSPSNPDSPNSGDNPVKVSDILRDTLFDVDDYENILIAKDKIKNSDAYKRTMDKFDPTGERRSKIGTDAKNTLNSVQEKLDPKLEQARNTLNTHVVPKVDAISDKFGYTDIPPELDADNQPGAVHSPIRDMADIYLPDRLDNKVKRRYDERKREQTDPYRFPGSSGGIAPPPPPRIPGTIDDGGIVNPPGGIRGAILPEPMKEYAAESAAKDKQLFRNANGNIDMGKVSDAAKNVGASAAISAVEGSDTALGKGMRTARAAKSVSNASKAAKAALNAPNAASVADVAKSGLSAGNALAAAAPSLVKEGSAADKGLSAANTAASAAKTAAAVATAIAAPNPASIAKAAMHGVNTLNNMKNTASKVKDGKDKKEDKDNSGDAALIGGVAAVTVAPFILLALPFIFIGIIGLGIIFSMVSCTSSVFGLSGTTIEQDVSKFDVPSVNISGTLPSSSKSKAEETSSELGTDAEATSKSEETSSELGTDAEAASKSEENMQ